MGSERQQVVTEKSLAKVLFMGTTVSGLVVEHSRWDQEGSPSVLFIKP